MASFSSLGQSLLFNDKAVDGPKIPGLSGEMEKKKKKKNKKKSKDNQDDEITAKKEKNEDVDMEGATFLFSEEDAVDETQKAMALQDGRKRLQNIFLLTCPEVTGCRVTCL